MTLAYTVAGVAACGLLVVIGLVDMYCDWTRPSAERRQWQDVILGLWREGRIRRVK